jgi:uncharacterized protein
MDLDLSFSQTNTKDITILSNTASVKASVKNIILTERGTAIFSPYFGTSIKKYLFEIADANLANDLIEEIKSALTIWENRIKIDKIDVSLEDDEITLTVTIVYTIIQNNVQDTITTALVRDR